jgi:hypothetical protein
LALRLNEGLGHTRLATGGRLKQPSIELAYDEGLPTWTTIADLCASSILDQLLLQRRELGLDHGLKLHDTNLPELFSVCTASLNLASTLPSLRRQERSRSAPRCTQRGQPADHRAAPGCAKRTQPNDHGTAGSSAMCWQPAFGVVWPNVRVKPPA